MTLDPGQPTREVDLAHVDEFFVAGAAVLGLGLATLTIGWTGALALAMATLCLACPNDLEPR